MEETDELHPHAVADGKHKKLNDYENSMARKIVLELVEKPARFKIAGTVYTYEGETVDGKMQGCGRLILGSNQFLEGRWEMNRLIDPSFCRLTCDTIQQTVSIVLQQKDYLLSSCGDDFLSVVSPCALGEVDFTASLGDLKTSFFRKLVVSEILRDTIRSSEGVSHNDFMTKLITALKQDEVADPIVRLNTLLFLYKHSKEPNLPSILIDENAPNFLRGAASNIRNSKALQSLNLQGIITKVCLDKIKQHRQMLVCRCPADFSLLAIEIQRLPDSKILYVTKDDLGMFEYLVSMPCFKQHEQFFKNLVDLYIQSMNTIPKYTPPSEVIPLISPVYFHLVKSFVEVISEIIELTGCTYADLMVCDSKSHHPKGSIKWPECRSNDSQECGISKTKLSLKYRKALEAQYIFIFELIEHYSPGRYVKNKIYLYEFQMLEDPLLNEKPNEAEKVGRLEKTTNETGHDVELEKTTVGSEDNAGLEKSAAEVDVESKEELKDLPDEQLVWLRILDHTIHKAFKGNQQLLEHLEPFRGLFRRHMTLVKSLAVDSCESLRVLTMSVLKYVIYTAPYIVDRFDEPSDDTYVFTRQMLTIIMAYRELQLHPSTCKYVSDLMFEYSRYWKLRSLITIKDTSGFFLPQVTMIVQKLVRTVVISLSKPAPTKTWVNYFKSISEVLNGLVITKFQACWFVKTNSCDPELMEKVNNYFSDDVHRVTNVEAFIHALQTRGISAPNHHVIQTAYKWIECIDMCLRRDWASKAKPLHGSRLECAGVLLDGIRRFLAHITEQSQFIDFEAPEIHLVKPFESLVKRTSNPILFRKTVEKMVENVRQSLWCMERADTDIINHLCQLLESANSFSNTEKLLDCYDVFRSQYRHYILKYSSLLAKGKTCSMVPTKKIYFSQWTEEFKTKEIPRLLAGVTAFWSYLSSPETFPTPHFLQILCILRLLGVDQSAGVENHFARVMSGEGKTVILALVAATLAVTGHNVKVVCHNEYLSSRDNNSFCEFFKMAGIRHKIHYVTLQNLVEILRHPFESYSSLVKVSSDDAEFPLTPNTKNTVLLFDEVDALISRKFAGNVDTTVTSTKLSGLTAVQDKIWSLAKTKKWDAQQVVRFTKIYIDDHVRGGHSLLRELNAYRNVPGTYSVLDTDENGELCVKEYTNKSFFEDRLLRMAKAALKVAHSYVGWVNTDIIKDRDGTICCRYFDCDIDDIIFGYYNTFNFLRLKSPDCYADPNSACNYSSQHYLSNYGYLLLHSGKISYARVPSLFPLMLGVSGTLPTSTAIDVYNVKIFTTIPTSFGNSSNNNTDFLFVHHVKHWQENICDRVKQMIKSNRAVLIFFESEKELDLFAKEGKVKFDQLNVLTEKTESRVRDEYINEAGQPCSVTVATRGMGRGVDYKSSPDVENKGGIHVIQTFFSVDTKEENHIRGRTARQGNKGSYELIICKKHLIRENIIPVTDSSIHSYTSLNEMRSKLMDEEESLISGKLAKSDRDHNTTIKFFYPACKIPNVHEN